MKAGTSIHPSVPLMRAVAGEGTRIVAFATPRPPSAWRSTATTCSSTPVGPIVVEPTVASIGPSTSEQRWIA